MSKRSLYWLFGVPFLVAMVIAGDRPICETRSLDEMTSGILYGSAQREDKAAFIYMAGLKPDLAIYDFSGNEVRLLRDGRVEGFGVFTVLATSTGFAFCNVVFAPVFYHVNPEGTFLSKERGKEYAGWPESAKIKYMCPLGTDRALCTLKHEDGRIFGLWLDFSARTFTPLGAPEGPPPEFDYRWIALGGSLYKIYGNTGQILAVDPDTFRTSRIIRKAEEPVRKKKIRPRRDPHYAILEQPLSLGGRIFMRWNRFRDPFGQDLAEVELVSLMLVDDGLTPLPVLAVASHAGKTLVYDRSERLLFLVDGFPFGSK